MGRVLVRKAKVSNCMVIQRHLPNLLSQQTKSSTQGGGQTSQTVQQSHSSIVRIDIHEQ